MDIGVIGRIANCGINDGLILDAISQSQYAVHNQMEVKNDFGKEWFNNLGMGVEIISSNHRKRQYDTPWYSRFIRTN